eukprot:CAMPEP_0115348570 /NCGR_PEP_ID=MMETSP0270-20121206/95473_1 /TAXON_ID=71861 /ORGANISM="Scrippsiella trochoidea, Strain CCMP3099" /LENGTH=42 /DNA_ID= /DNA_START= /DNA_END= /DNA_ORIENTATION=
MARMQHGRTPCTHIDAHGALPAIKVKLQRCSVLPLHTLEPIH